MLRWNWSRPARCWERSKFRRVVGPFRKVIFVSTSFSVLVSCIDAYDSTYLRLVSSICSYPQPSLWNVYLPVLQVCFWRGRCLCHKREWYERFTWVQHVSKKTFKISACCQRKTFAQRECLIRRLTFQIDRKNPTYLLNIITDPNLVQNGGNVRLGENSRVSSIRFQGEGEHALHSVCSFRSFLETNHQIVTDALRWRGEHAEPDPRGEAWVREGGQRDDAAGGTGDAEPNLRWATDAGGRGSTRWGAETPGWSEGNVRRDDVRDAVANQVQVKFHARKFWRQTAKYVYLLLFGQSLHPWSTQKFSRSCCNKFWGIPWTRPLSTRTCCGIFPGVDADLKRAPSCKTPKRIWESSLRRGCRRASSRALKTAAWTIGAKINSAGTPWSIREINQLGNSVSKGAKL